MGTPGYTFFMKYLWQHFQNLPEGNTNNFAEAHAIERALEHAVKSCEKAVEIRTDSSLGLFIFLDFQ